MGVSLVSTCGNALTWGRAAHSCGVKGFQTLHLTLEGIQRERVVWRLDYSKGRIPTTFALGASRPQLWVHGRPDLEEPFVGHSDCRVTHWGTCAVELADDHKAPTPDLGASRWGLASAGLEAFFGIQLFRSGR